LDNWNSGSYSSSAAICIWLIVQHQSIK
jgi:hypothetical protein